MRRRNVLRRFDGLDDFVDVVERLLEAEEDVFAVFCGRKIKLGSALHHFLSMADEIRKNAFQRQRLGNAFDQHHHVVVESLFELRMLVEIVQDRLRLRVVFELDDDADVLGGFVANVAHALQFFIAHQIRNRDDEIGFVYAIRNRRDDDDVIALFVFGYFRNASHHHGAAAGCVRVRDILRVIGDAAHGKVGALYEFEQIFGRRVGIINQVHGRVHHLA